MIRNILLAIPFVAFLVLASQHERTRGGDTTIISLIASGEAVCAETWGIRGLK